MEVGSPLQGCHPLPDSCLHRRASYRSGLEDLLGQHASSKNPSGGRRPRVEARDQHVQVSALSRSNGICHVRWRSLLLPNRAARGEKERAEMRGSVPKEPFL